MTTHRTEAQIREEKIAAMGEKLGEVHFLLWKDLTWLSFEWHQYVELFGTDPTRVDIMNSSAPRFFWSLDRVLWQDILLSLSRLADPPGTGGKQNLTFHRLSRLTPNDGPRTELDTAINEYEKAVKFARDWRHALFAHRDLDHAMEPDANPLAEASRASVIAAIQSAAAVMNLIELHYQKSTTAYDAVIDPIGGAYDLLYYLDLGLQARESDQAREDFWQPRFR